MTKTRSVPFAELRQFLQRLGYKEKSSSNAWIFHRSGKDLLVFRRYSDTDLLEEHDLVSTRRFLDARGLLDSSEFDAFLRQATTPA